MRITSSEYIKGGTKPEDYPIQGEPEFVFMGRSNVGKSSLINALTNRKNLAYTSQEPGKTRVLNFFFINQAFYFVDVPGYGYQKNSKDAYLEYGKMMEKYLAAKKNLKVCFLLVDARRITDDDLLMLNYLKSMNAPIAICATKLDKLRKSEVLSRKKEISAALELTDSPIFFVSNEKKMGIEEVLTYIGEHLS
jgi:GTP-binding protein